MVTMFYWIWSVIGLLIVLAIIVMLMLAITIGIKFYKVAVLMYKEQQELIDKVDKVVEENPIVDTIESESDKGDDEDKVSTTDNK